jgi:hypothetical protein
MENQKLNILYEWDSISRLKYERGKIWYAIFIIIALGGIILSLLTENFLLTIIIILLAVILVMSYTIPVKILEIVLTDNAIIIDGEFISYNKIGNFWLAEVYEINYLYFQVGRSENTVKIKSVPILGEANPLKIREILMDVGITENIEPPEKDIWDSLSIFFRI